MRFCIRDDDTSFFTSPDDLEQAYRPDHSNTGPCRLLLSRFIAPARAKVIPDRYRGRWSTHPLHGNRALVDYLRLGVAGGRYEIMLHGFFHDEPDGSFRPRTATISVAESWRGASIWRTCSAVPCAYSCRRTTQLDGRASGRSPRTAASGWRRRREIRVVTHVDRLPGASGCGFARGNYVRGPACRGCWTSAIIVR